MRIAARSAPPVVYTALIMLIAVIYAAVVRDLLSQQTCLVLLSALLLAYVWFEIKLVGTRQKELLFLNPVVLASILTFVLEYGLSNILYFLPEDLVARVGLEPEVTNWMNFLMMLVLLGALGMWLGYWSSLGTHLAGVLAQSRFLGKWLRREYQMRYGFLASCVALSLLSRIWMIQLGVYGYSSDYTMLYELAAYREYLGIGGALGKMALMGVALQYYSQEARKPHSWSLLLLILAYEVFFGFVSGFKSLVVMPFIIVGFCAYFHEHRFPRWLFPAVITGIFMAYLIIEPFRVARHEDARFQSTSAVYIVDKMFGAAAGAASSADEGPAVWLSFLARANMTSVASRGIEFAHMGPLPEDAPAFLSDILLAPFHALIPRLVWKSKPFQNLGLWYTQYVFGYEFVNATGMGPFTYLYFAGGVVAVFMGFFVVGVVQRVWLELFLLAWSGGVVICMAMLSGLVNIESSFNAFFIGLVRFFPMLLLAQYGLFKR